MINLSLHLHDDGDYEGMHTEIDCRLDVDGELSVEFTEHFNDNSESLSIYLGWKLAESLRDQLTKLLQERKS